jgi:quercetin dioxygenase-like cupin family protein
LALPRKLSSQVAVTPEVNMFKLILAAAVLAASAALAADAQSPKRTVLEQIDVPGSAYTTIVAITEIEPNALVERHIHPGTEITYVLEGGGDMFIEGKPVMHVRAGDHWQVAAGTPHYLQNGPNPTRLLVTYVLEKEKPLAIPMPDKPGAR